jgi:hypothetical protein
LADYLLMTSRVRNPGPDLEHANQRGEAKPYNGIATIPMNAINMSLYVYFQLLLFKQKLPLYRNISKNNKNVQSTQYSRQMSI